MRVFPSYRRFRKKEQFVFLILILLPAIDQHNQTFSMCYTRALSSLRIHNLNRCQQQINSKHEAQSGSVGVMLLPFMKRRKIHFDMLNFPGAQHHALNAAAPSLS